jgi:hypothetical protein
VEDAGLFVSRDNGENWAEVEGLTRHPTRKSWFPGGGGLCLHTIVPDAADPKKMTAAVSKEKLDGYFLTVSVDPFKYDGGNLKVSMKLTIMTHTRDLKGEIGKSLQMPGVSSPSKPDEDDLIKMAAEKLVNDFAGLKP